MKAIFGLIMLLCFCSCVYNPPARLSVHPIDMFMLNDFGHPEHRCSDTPDFVVVDKHISTKIANIIKRSVDYWNSIGVRKVFMYIGYYDRDISEVLRAEGFIAITGMSKKDKESRRFSNLAATSVSSIKNGCIHASYILLKLDRFEKMDKDKAETAIRHELGHTLGFTDSWRIKDLMYGTIMSRDSLKVLSKEEIESYHVFYK